MPAERDALEAFTARIEPRGSADAARRRGDHLRRRRRALTSIGACAVVLALIGGVAVAADRVTEDSQTHIVDTPSTTIDPYEALGIDPWEQLPAPPVPVDRGTAVLPLREDVAFVWGSTRGSAGAILEQDEGRVSWRPIAGAPAELGTGPAVALHTDRDIVVLTGESSDPAHAAVYNPLSDTWRMTAAPPFTMSDAMTLGWAGTEVFVYGAGGGDCVAEHQGFAYDLASDAWRQLPDPPFGVRAGAAAAWASGRLVVVGGSQQRCSNEPVDPRRDGAMYDPRSDSWTPVSEHPTADPSWARTIGEQVIVFDKRCGDGCTSAATFHPLTGEWRDLGSSGPPLPRWLITDMQFRIAGWSPDGGHVLNEDGEWVDAPAIPAQVPLDPRLVHLVGGPGGRVLVLAPEQAWRFPSDARIEASLATADAISQLMTHARFPQGVSLDQVPLADEVTFAFRSTVLGTKSRDELANEDAWAFDYPRGTLDGSFSVLDVLREQQRRWVGSGQGGRCSSPPPPGAEALRQAGVFGDVEAPCEEWWSVDVFIDRDGLIRFIRYDRGAE